MEFEISADGKRKIDSLYNHICAAVWNLGQHVNSSGAGMVEDHKCVCATWCMCVACMVCVCVSVRIVNAWLGRGRLLANANEAFMLGMAFFAASHGILKKCMLEQNTNRNACLSRIQTEMHA
eukprot:1142567-Pelagomonas_calceolata.AAC.1